MYHICKREMWLHANGITMEHNSDTVYEGKLIGKTTYPQRAAKYQEVDLGIAKIDFYDARNKVVHEIKKSDKMEEAHRWQVRYYLYLLRAIGVNNATGILEYPKLRKTEEVFLTEEDCTALEEKLSAIDLLLSSPECPKRLTKKTFCKSCSYFDFCWSN